MLGQKVQVEVGYIPEGRRQQVDKVQRGRSDCKHAMHNLSIMRELTDDMQQTLCAATSAVTVDIVNSSCFPDCNLHSYYHSCTSTTLLLFFLLSFTHSA
jgi:hypothetical protein